MTYPAPDLLPSGFLAPSTGVPAYEPPELPTPPVTAAERTLAFLRHLFVDEESDDLLIGWTTALATALERAALVAHGDATVPPGAALRDPRVAPDWALPSAAQWTGGTLPAPFPDEPADDYVARARVAVVRPRGMRRGGGQALIDIVRPLLTGPWDERYVLIVEQYGGDSWSTLVVTRAAQTPDPAQIVAACNAADVVVAGEKIEHADSDAVLWVEAELAWDDADPASSWSTVTLADVT